MKVLKFGGTSVGSAQRIKNVASISLRSGTENSSTLCHGRDNKLFSGDI